MWAWWSICAVNETVEVMASEERLDKAAPGKKITLVEFGNALGKIGERGHWNWVGVDWGSHGSGIGVGFGGWGC